MDDLNNVTKFPMTRAMRFRHAVNKTKDALFEPQQVTYNKEWSEPKAPVEGALDDHIRTAQENAPESLNLPRQDHFEAGQHEATIHSFRAQQIKRNMRAGDESVGRMINMEDPTKD